jgi:hypothetical protein
MQAPRVHGVWTALIELRDWKSFARPDRPGSCCGANEMHGPTFREVADRQRSPFKEGQLEK